MNDANKLPKCRLIALPQFSLQSVKLQSLIRADSLMHFPARQIMIPRRSRGFFLDGRSPLLLATRHVALVRSDTCI